MPEDDILAFAATSIGSVWALELLLVLSRDHERSWTTEELIRELRSSPVVIDEALKQLQHAGLVVKNDTGAYRFQPASAVLGEFVAELDRVYAVKPMTVIKAIMTVPSDKLRAFSDAFRLKD